MTITPGKQCLLRTMLSYCLEQLPVAVALKETWGFINSCNCEKTLCYSFMLSVPVSSAFL